LHTDDEGTVRTLVRILAVVLGLMTASAGAAGVWLSRASDADVRDVRARVERAADAFMTSRGVSAADKAGHAATLRTLLDAAQALRRPPLFGGLLAGTAVLIGLAALLPGGAPPSGPLPAKQVKGGKPAPLGKAAAAPGKTAEPAKPGKGQLAQDVAPAPDRSRKKLVKSAALLEKEQGAEAAADLLLDNGLRDEAVEVLLRAGLSGRAAEVRHDQNRFEEAADLFAEANRFEQAGKIYAQIEKYAESAECYLRIEKKSVAAEMFERAEEFRRAGDCYRDIGFGRHAAQAYLKAGAEADAASALVLVFDEEGGIAAAKSETAVREMKSIAKRAGDLFFKLGQLEEADAILCRGELFGAAAQVAFHRGQHARAAELFEKVGRGDLAARALREMGDEKGASRMLGLHLHGKGDYGAAASHLALAEEWSAAAGAYRSVEQYAEAAECYFRGQDYAAAAEMFRVVPDLVRAGEAYARYRQFGQAAECLREAGDLAGAAQMMEKAGDAFGAGTLYLELDQSDDAIRTLQQVPADHVRFSEACAALGRIFAERGMDSLCIKKYEQATADDAVSAANVEAFYGLALACQRRGDYARAVEIFEAILAYDYQYADVADLHQRAKQQRETARAAPAAGAVDGARYEVLREIGRGGMGVVYMARDSLLERDVAYKVLPEQLRESPDALRNFLREAKAAAQLNHPNIVTVYDVGESQHGYYLAMELVSGTTLKEIVQKRGPVAPGGLVYILRQMADALGYAHGRKVVHRDIKTANTMWTTDKQVKIMDFGLAKLLEEVRNQTTTISGTPFYMSPEQTLGKNVDHRTDLYSLGVTMFELATGHLPFRRGNVPYHHVHTPAPDPRTLNQSLPAPVAEVILRCLEKSPDDRYPSAKALIEDLTARMKQG
jgi:tetratricopeptide (TPR) repeat protein